ncbi:hypothetical protein ADK34_10400 [Streptomyces viridochromogenes]|uniref:Uncharacterized protein n=1 Tax=Streptomyces viridochromogenes TaxID=1938 RepID=A0A0L8L0K6_STRVR|nr:hypothetical protein ADK34_10400 [Streptomyces viridochromogenes]
MQMRTEMPWALATVPGVRSGDSRFQRMNRCTLSSRTRSAPGSSLECRPSCSVATTDSRSTALSASRSATGCSYARRMFARRLRNGETRAVSP